jgi:hypothetical protein
MPKPRRPCRAYALTLGEIPRVSCPIRCWHNEGTCRDSGQGRVAGGAERSEHLRNKKCDYVSCRDSGTRRIRRIARGNATAWKVPLHAERSRARIPRHALLVPLSRHVSLARSRSGGARFATHPRLPSLGRCRGLEHSSVPDAPRHVSLHQCFTTIRPIVPLSPRWPGPQPVAGTSLARVLYRHDS